MVLSHRSGPTLVMTIKYFKLLGHTFFSLQLQLMLLFGHKYIQVRLYLVNAIIV